MKKLVSLTLIVMLSGIYSAVNAAPVGNIAQPAIMKSLVISGEGENSIGIIAAGEADIGFDRKIKDADGDVEISAYTSKLGVTVANKATLYCLLGAGSAKESATISGSKIEVETETGFLWGIGANIIAYEKEIQGFGDGVLRLGGDIKYRSCNPDIDEFTIDGTTYSLDALGVTNANAEYGEFQVALAASYQMDSFVPYLGVKFATLDGEVKGTYSGTEYKLDYEEDENVGMFAGFDFLINDSIALNFEGRFIDEEAISVGGTIRF